MPLLFVPLMIYEMIPENSRSTVSFSSFLVYFSTYVIILQENIGMLIENRRRPESNGNSSYFLSRK